VLARSIGADVVGAASLMIVSRGVLGCPPLAEPCGNAYGGIAGGGAVNGLSVDRDEGCPCPCVGEYVSACGECTPLTIMAPLLRWSGGGGPLLAGPYGA
jgi:hypothetical protein